MGLRLMEDLEVVPLWIYFSDSMGERKISFQGAFL